MLSGRTLAASFFCGLAWRAPSSFAQKPGSLPPGPPINITPPLLPSGQKQVPPGPLVGAKTPSADAIKAANLFEKAVKYQAAGKNDEAVKTYRELLKIAPLAYPAYVNLGDRKSTRLNSSHG